ncbi:MAG: DNA primase [Bradymonadia bacterium]
MISDQTKAEILDKADIVQVVGKVVTLKKAGSIFKGLCPFHDEKSPSFTVSPVRRTYHCFGCGVHGDAIRFVMEQNALSFPEALRDLAGQFGVHVPETRREDPQQRAARQQKRSETERLFAAQGALTDYYTRALFGPTGDAARRYLGKREISVESAQAFRLGWADGDTRRFAEFMQVSQISQADMIALGVLVIPEDRADRAALLGGGYLRFRRRLMFPVVDVRGMVTGYSGRILDANAKSAKYLNSPETPLFTKGEQLYGAYTARAAGRKAGRILLCEGNVDVIAMWQAGFTNTVAAMGTALTPQQVRLAKRLSDNVVCIMDGDAAGAKAAFASLLPFLEAGMQPRAVMLPQGEDPDSFLSSEGAETLRAMLDDAPPLLDLHIARTTKRHPADPPGRIAALRDIAPALRELSDSLTQTLYRAQVSTALDLPLAVIDGAIAEVEPPAPAASAEPWKAPAAPEPAAPWATEPPVWDDVPPNDEPPPEAWIDNSAPPTGLDLLAQPTRTPTLHDIPRYEVELCEYIAEYPHLAHRLEAEDAFKFLTNAGLADFLVRLCSHVSSGAPFNEDRLLRDYDKIDKSVVAFWRERQTRHSGLTESDAERALDEARIRTEQGWLRRERTALSKQLRAFKSPNAKALMAQYQTYGQRMKQLNAQLIQASSSNAEGAP